MKEDTRDTEDTDGLEAIAEEIGDVAYQPCVRCAALSAFLDVEDFNA